MKELFKNAAKIKQLYDEGHYFKAAVLFLKTMAALAAEFEEGEAGILTVKATKKVTKADAKQLEKAEATLESMRQSAEGQHRAAAGGFWLALILQNLPHLIDLIRKLRPQPATA